MDDAVEDDPAPAVEATEALRRAAHAAFVRSPPSARQLAVVAAALGAGEVRHVERLTGGIATSVHRVDYDRCAVVVRRYFRDVAPGTTDRAEPLPPYDRAEREVAVLRSLADTPVPAPDVLFADTDGSRTGVPLLVQTLLPGRGIDPPDDPAWSRRLAAALLVIHDQRPAIGSEEWTHDWCNDAMPAYLVGAPRAAEVWAVITAHRRALRAEPTTLVHHDYHPGNTLWAGGELTGVVDWNHAGSGSAGSDAAYCALDLTVAKGPAFGARFLRDYEALAGRPVHPAWRAVAATRAIVEVEDWRAGYLDLGIAVTTADLRRRLDTWIDETLAATR